MLRAVEYGLGQALALETAAGELAIGHLGQLFEAGGRRMRLLNHNGRELGSNGIQSRDDAASGREISRLNIGFLPIRANPWPLYIWYSTSNHCELLHGSNCLPHGIISIC